MPGSVANGVDIGVFDACTGQDLADVGLVGRRGELDSDLGAALEVDAAGNAVPEQHAEHASHGKNQRKTEEVPLPAQPIDICVTKQFHLKSDRKSMPRGMPCQNSMLSTPATEKTSEKLRKYHFRPSQSIFALRNSST